MKAVVTAKNMKNIIEQMKSCDDSEFDFSGTHFYSTNQIEEIFMALPFNRQFILKLNDCTFNERAACIQQLKLSLMVTPNIHTLELKSVHFEIPQMMEVVVRGLCRNHGIMFVYIDGTNATHQVINDLINHPKLTLLSIDNLVLNLEIASAFTCFLEKSELTLLQLKHLSLDQTANEADKKQIIYRFYSALNTLPSLQNRNFTLDDETVKPTRKATKNS